MLETAAEFGEVPRAETSRQHQRSVSWAGLAHWEQGLAGEPVTSGGCSGYAEHLCSGCRQRSPNAPGRGESLAEQLPQQQGELKPASPFLQPERLLRSAEKQGAKVNRFLFAKYVFDTLKWWASLYAQLNTLSETIRPVWLPAFRTPLPLLASAQHHGARTPVGVWAAGIARHVLLLSATK